MKDLALRYLDDVIEAIEKTNLRGIGDTLKFGALRARDLRALVESSDDEDVHRAAEVGFYLGYLMAGIQNKSVKAALDGSREKAIAAELFDWKTIYTMAEERGWELPLERDQKSALKTMVLARLEAAGTSITEKTFRRHYDIAVGHAARFREDERHQWLQGEVSRLCAKATQAGKTKPPRADWERVRDEYKTRFAMTARDFRKDLILQGFAHLLPTRTRSK